MRARHVKLWMASDLSNSTREDVLQAICLRVPSSLFRWTNPFLDLSYYAHPGLNRGMWPTGGQEGVHAHVKTRRQRIRRCERQRTRMVLFLRCSFCSRPPRATCPQQSPATQVAGLHTSSTNAPFTLRAPAFPVRSKPRFMAGCPLLGLPACRARKPGTLPRLHRPAPACSCKLPRRKQSVVERHFPSLKLGRGTAVTQIDSQVSRELGPPLLYSETLLSSRHPRWPCGSGETMNPSIRNPIIAP
jgi:hypothetical protein